MSRVSRGAEDVVLQYEICLESIHGLQPKEGCSYGIKWKRGDKWSGRTPQVASSSMGIVVLNRTITFTSTLQCKSPGRYHKKSIEFTVNEYGPRGGKADKRRAAEMRADLAEAMHCTRKTMVLADKRGGTAALMISVTAAPPSLSSPVGLSPGGGDVDLHTDLAPTVTSAGGHSDDDADTATLAEESEASPRAASTPAAPRPLSAPTNTSVLSDVPLQAPAEAGQGGHPQALEPPTIEVAPPPPLRLQEAEAKAYALEEEVRRLTAALKAEKARKSAPAGGPSPQLQAQLQRAEGLLQEAETRAEKAEGRCTQLQADLERQRLEGQCLREQAEIAAGEAELAQDKAADWERQALALKVQLEQLEEERHAAHTAHLEEVEQLQDELRAQSSQLTATRGELRAAGQLAAEGRAVVGLVLCPSCLFGPEGVPLVAVGLVLLLERWQAFHPRHAPKGVLNTGLTNLLGALERLPEIHAATPPALAYWVSALFHLLAQLSIRHPCAQVPRHLQSQSVLAAAARRLHAVWGARPTPARAGDPPGGPGLVLQGQAGGLPVVAPDALPPGEAGAVAEGVLLEVATAVLVALTDVLAALLRDTCRALDMVVVVTVFGREPLEDRGMEAIMRCLDALYDVVAANHVPGRIRDAIFHTIFGHINALLFNRCLEPPAICSMPTALRLKMCVRHLEKWQHDKALGNACRGCLDPIREVANVLAVRKELLLEHHTRCAVCPTLQIPHLVALLRHHAPDTLDPEGVPPALLTALEGEALGMGPTPPGFPDPTACLAPQDPPPVAPPFAEAWLPSLEDVPPMDPHAVPLPPPLAALLEAP